MVPLSPEQQTVVKGCWIIDSIFIEDQRARHGTNFQQGDANPANCVRDENF